MADSLNIVLETSIASALERAVLRRLAPGVALCIYRAGDLRLYSKGVANIECATPIDQGTLFPIGCISDLIYCWIGFHLEERGLFYWDQPLHEQLPAFPRHGSKFGRVTARHLIAQSSGLNFPRSVFFGQPILDCIKEIGRIFDPGTFFSPSVCHGWLLHELFEKLWPGCLTEFVRNHRCGFEVGTEATGYVTNSSGFIQAPDTLLGHGRVGIKLTMTELARLGGLFVRVYNRPGGRGSTVPTGLATSLLPYNFAYSRDPKGIGRCLPWQQFFGRSFTYRGHSSGHEITLLISPDNELSIAIGANSSSASSLFSDLLQCSNLAAVLQETPQSAPSSQRPQKRVAIETCTDAARICGIYEMSGEQIYVKLENGNLTLSGESILRYPPIHCKHSPITFSSNGVFSVSVNTPSGAPTKITGAFLTGNDHHASWLQLADMIYARPTAN